MADLDPYAPAKLVETFLHAIEHSILPLTKVGVESGNKVFGAAILRKDDLSLVLGATNFETSSPLLVCPIPPLKTFCLLARARLTWSTEKSTVYNNSTLCPKAHDQILKNVCSLRRTSLARCVSLPGDRIYDINDSESDTRTRSLCDNLVRIRQLLLPLLIREYT